MKLSLLNQAEYTVQRERLLASDCTALLRRYALQCRSRILITPPEIDQNGCDFLLEDDFYYVPIQLKSVKGIMKPDSQESATSSWEIHPKFLAPNFQDSTQLCLTIDGSMLGLPGGGGGVLLQEFFGDVETSAPLQIKYYYTDVFYIMAVYRSYWKVKNFGSARAKILLENLKDLLSKNNIKDRINIPKAAFVPISNPAAVLSWRMHIEPSSSVIGSNFTRIFVNSEQSHVDERFLRMYQFMLSRFIPTDLKHNFDNYLSQEDFCSFAG